MQYPVRRIVVFCSVLAVAAHGPGGGEATAAHPGDGPAMARLPPASVAPRPEIRVEHATRQKAEPAVPKLSEATVRARLADVEVKPSPRRPGWLAIGTWREPEMELQDRGFRLVMVWNGLDDDKWPATRISEVLAAEICGPIRSGVMEDHLDRLYQSKSLVPEVDLGGNAGSSFRKRLVASLGACRVEMLAEGARWHTLTIVVRR